jgi:hypothetical protein
MSASCLLDACRAAGLSLEAEGEDLFVEADCDPPAALLNELRLHKVEIVALLREPVATKPQEGPVAEPSGGAAVTFVKRAAHWELGGRRHAEAKEIAGAEIQNRWHMEHGERVPREICAGCRRPVGTAVALDLIDGSRVHLDGANACLIQHGKRWRAAATRALMALGLRVPVGVDQ